MATYSLFLGQQGLPLCQRARGRLHFFSGSFLRAAVSAADQEGGRRGWESQEGRRAPPLSLTEVGGGSSGLGMNLSSFGLEPKAEL